MATTLTTRRAFMLVSTGYVSYSFGRGVYKSTKPVAIRSERSKRYRRYPSLYNDDEPYNDETRPPLLSERLCCIAASPFSTFLHLREDVLAAEVKLRNDSDPAMFGLERHPFFNRTYESVSDFVIG